jgi:hypothetical protein
MVINLFPIESDELLPFGGNDDSLGFVARVNSRGADLDLLLD